MENDSDVKVLGIDAQEMQEWIESFDAILKAEGRESASLLLDRLRARAESLGVGHAFTANTPYVNTIPADQQPVSISYATSRSCSNTAVRSSTQLREAGENVRFAS